jgi:hypothetical protein
MWHPRQQCEPSYKKRYDGESNKPSVPILADALA